MVHDSGYRVEIVNMGGWVCWIYGVTTLANISIHFKSKPKVKGSIDLGKGAIRTH